MRFQFSHLHCECAQTGKSVEIFEKRASRGELSSYGLKIGLCDLKAEMQKGARQNTQKRTGKKRKPYRNPETENGFPLKNESFYKFR